MVWKATVSSKGQLTIPKPVREALKLEPGTKVLFTLREGKAELEPVSGDIQQWRGALRTEGTATPLGKVRGQVRQAIAEEVVREMQGD
jgi:AbrB family looped-hinge helix DNA binding protein